MNNSNSNRPKSFEEKLAEIDYHSSLTPPHKRKSKHTPRVESEKHAPGPWSICDEGDTVWIFDGQDVGPDEPGDPTGFVVCSIDTTPNDTRADARLIAAAPELLEALEWALHHIEETQGLKGDELSVIKNAIAKATGGAE